MRRFFSLERPVVRINYIRQPPLDGVTYWLEQAVLGDLRGYFFGIRVPVSFALWGIK